ncbi:MAG: PqqD family protein, partial [Armatimonadota bacterium]
MRLPSFVTGLLERVGLRKKQMPLSRDQAFEARPVRNPRLKWRINDEDFVEVIIPRGQDLFSRAMGFLFFVPKSRPVVLDEVGTRVWDLCDGENTVDEIIRELCSEYKLARREVEVSLTEFLRTLGKRGMVGFVVPKEFVEDFDGELVGLKEVGTTREELEAAQQEAARAVDEPE